jgi:hypothetical protein
MEVPSIFFVVFIKYVVIRVHAERQSPASLQQDEEQSVVEYECFSNVQCHMPVITLLKHTLNATKTQFGRTHAILLLLGSFVLARITVTCKSPTHSLLACCALCASIITSRRDQKMRKGDNQANAVSRRAKGVPHNYGTIHVL